VEGNKRLSWLAVVVFLDLNGCEVILRRHRVGGDRWPSSGLKHVLNANQYSGVSGRRTAGGQLAPGTSRCRRVDLERVGGPTRNLTPRPLEADSGWSELRQVA
jgi:hypothetical protein